MRTSNSASSFTDNSKPQPAPRPMPEVSRESGGNLQPMPDPYRRG